MDTLDFFYWNKHLDRKREKSTPHLESGKKFKTIITSDIQESSHTQNI
jgi:hypothetical protein